MTLEKSVSNIALSSQPIGVFDSGMGGLTVLRALAQRLPQESFLYVGDTARLPYGTKSQETVKHYAEQMATLLINRGIKLLIIACNTATAAALPYLQHQFPEIPIIGVVEPGARAALQATRNNKIAVLATETTIASGLYQNTLRDLNPTIDISMQACCLFVALAEEGCVDDEIAHLVAKKYLSALLNKSDPIDCVLLGCTHFPVLLPTLTALLPDTIHIINSAHPTAELAHLTLARHDLLNAASDPRITFLVTDLPERFIRHGKLFFGADIDPETVHLVDVNYSNA